MSKLLNSLPFSFPLSGKIMATQFSSQEKRIWLGELDYSFNLFQLIVNLDCVPNLQTFLWKTATGALSMNLVALILIFVELISPI